jgi:hypothetical protein
MNFVSANELSKRPLVLAALHKGEVISDKGFEPNAEVTVGSNSGNDLVIAERFELTSYKLISNGSVLHVLPPLNVQAWVWWNGEPLELRGFFRDIRKRVEGIASELPLASDRFVVSYSTGVVFMGRFT